MLASPSLAFTGAGSFQLVAWVVTQQPWEAQPLRAMCLAVALVLELRLTFQRWREDQGAR